MVYYGISMLVQALHPKLQQDACSGIHSACREENGHKVDIYVHATAQTVVNMGQMLVVIQ